MIEIKDIPSWLIKIISLSLLGFVLIGLSWGTGMVVSETTISPSALDIFLSMLSPMLFFCGFFSIVMAIGGGLFFLFSYKGVKR